MVKCTLVSRDVGPPMFEYTNVFKNRSFCISTCSTCHVMVMSETSEFDWL